MLKQKVMIVFLASIFFEVGYQEECKGLGSDIKKDQESSVQHSLGSIIKKEEVSSLGCKVGNTVATPEPVALAKQALPPLLYILRNNNVPLTKPLQPVQPQSLPAQPLPHSIGEKPNSQPLHPSSNTSSPQNKNNVHPESVENKSLNETFVRGTCTLGLLIACIYGLKKYAQHIKHRVLMDKALHIRNLIALFNDGKLSEEKFLEKRDEVLKGISDVERKKINQLIATPS